MKNISCIVIIILLLSCQIDGGGSKNDKETKDNNVTVVDSESAVAAVEEISLNEELIQQKTRVENIELHTESGTYSIDVDALKLLALDDSRSSRDIQNIVLEDGQVYNLRFDRNISLSSFEINEGSSKFNGNVNEAAILLLAAESISQLSSSPKRNVDSSKRIINSTARSGEVVRAAKFSAATYGNVISTLYSNPSGFAIDTVGEINNITYEEAILAICRNLYNEQLKQFELYSSKYRSIKSSIGRGVLHISDLRELMKIRAKIFAYGEAIDFSTSYIDTTLTFGEYLESFLISAASLSSKAVLANTVANAAQLAGCYIGITKVIDKYMDEHYYFSSININETKTWLEREDYMKKYSSENRMKIGYVTLRIVTKNSDKYTLWQGNLVNEEPSAEMFNYGEKGARMGGFRRIATLSRGESTVQTLKLSKGSDLLMFYYGDFNFDQIFFTNGVESADIGTLDNRYESFGDYTKDRYDIFVWQNFKDTML